MFVSVVPIFATCAERPTLCDKERPADAGRSQFVSCALALTFADESATHAEEGVLYEENDEWFGSLCL